MNISKVMDMLLREYSSHRHPTLRRSSKLKNPFKTLISCLLSLRTQDKNTEIASSRLFAVADTPEGILDLNLKRLEKLIFSSGHYKKKARVLKSVCKELLERFDGKVPKTREELMSIKGVGPKTANIVLSFAFGENVIAVDTHVHRLPNRLGWVKTKKPEETEIELMKIVPKKYWREINTTLILHGKNTCKPISPICSKCVICNYCKRVNVVKFR